MPASRKRDVLTAWLHDVVRPTTPIAAYDAAAAHRVFRDVPIENWFA